MNIVRAMVLGGYGLIGSACVRSLSAEGFEVTGVGRSRKKVNAASRSANWIIRDIPSITVNEWRSLLSGIQVVVNASGALQDGLNDDLEAIHVTAIARLIEAASAFPIRIIQISAAGSSADASTDFFRSKAKGDSIVASSNIDWVILRPTLVLAHDAYGGTALLRAAASFPIVMPETLRHSQIQTVYVGDVAAAVVAAAKGRVPSGTVADITEREGNSLSDLVESIRRWQGYGPPRFRIAVPCRILAVGGRAADFLGHLGWRSPLRSNALLALKDGIRGDPDKWEAVGGRPCLSLNVTLGLLPATQQERIFARTYLALPLAIGALAIFWCLSGLIALFEPARTIAIMTERGVPSWLAALTGIGGAVADMILGLAMLWRNWTQLAALGMLGLSTVYLFASIFVAPDLWIDPLGPMVKVLPAMALATMVWLMMDER